MVLNRNPDNFFAKTEQVWPSQPRRTSDAGVGNFPLEIRDGLPIFSSVGNWSTEKEVLK
ncbi:hypothetical protein J2W23_003950 [Variovorax boronicumulans]|nr:hypothetical protein [Variovorax boronicumulans]